MTRIDRGMTREERIEAALATVGKATPGPWELMEVGDKCKHLCPAHENISVLTVALEYEYGDSEEPTYFGAVYGGDDAALIAAAPDLRDEVIALRAKAERQETLLFQLANLAQNQHFEALAQTFGKRARLQGMVLKRHAAQDGDCHSCNQIHAAYAEIEAPHD